MHASLIRFLAAAAFAVVSFAASAQAPLQDAGPPADTQNLSQGELDQLVAPIALYPDPLLSAVLMAATYPLEVVEASRWAEQNKGLQGAELKAAADRESWDDSVKQLTATPSVLAMMSDKLSWMEKLGDAVLAQQPDVMDSVQRLRARAEAQNKLVTTKEQRVSRRREDDRDVIYIEPAEPEMIYVPYYDPAIVYGAWPYPAYPAYYWPPPAGYYYGPVAVGVVFATGFAVAAWATRDRWWGGGIGWGRRDIYYRRNVRDVSVSSNQWRHNADHRRGARYKNRDVANRFDRDRQRANINRNVTQPNRGNVGDGNRQNNNRVGDRNRQNTNRANVNNNPNRSNVNNERRRDNQGANRNASPQNRDVQRNSDRRGNANADRGRPARVNVDRGRGGGGGDGAARRGGGGGGGGDARRGGGGGGGGDARRGGGGGGGKAARGGGGDRKNR